MQKNIKNCPKNCWKMNFRALCAQILSITWEGITESSAQKGGDRDAKLRIFFGGG